MEQGIEDGTATVLCCNETCTNEQTRSKMVQKVSLTKNDQGAREYCHRCVLMVFHASPHLSHLQHTTSGRCTLFFDASDLDATSGERQLNSDVKIRHCYNMEVPCLRLSAHSAVQSNRKKRDKNILPVHSDVPTHNVISTKCFGF